jgi:hypothetical protein
VRTEAGGAIRVGEAVRSVYRAERAVERHETAGVGALLRARNAATKALGALAEVAAAERKAIEAVEADADLSASGKAKRFDTVRREHDQRRTAEAGKWLDGAERDLSERTTALERAWEKRSAKPGAPSELAQLVEQVRVANVLAASRVPLDGELVEAVASAGDGQLAAALLELYARTSSDSLLLQAAARKVRARTDAVRRAELFENPEALALAAEAHALRGAREGLAAIRAFLGKHPLETDLAREQLAKVFADLEP